MRVLALEIERPGGSERDIQPHLVAEATEVWRLYQEGIVREAFFRADKKCAVLVLESSGIEEAKAALGRLPLVRAGLIDFDVIPLVPYSGFSRLFAR